MRAIISTYTIFPCFVISSSASSSFLIISLLLHIMLQILVSPIGLVRNGCLFPRHHPLLKLSFECQQEVAHMTEQQKWRLQQGHCHSSDLPHTTTMKETSRSCVEMKRMLHKICTVQTFYGGCKLVGETKLGPAHTFTSRGLYNSDC